jgi:hypothetical protein
MRRTTIFVFALGILLLGAAAAIAGNTWNGYHWADEPHDGGITLTLVNDFDAAGAASYGTVYGDVLDDWDKNQNGGQGPLRLTSTPRDDLPSACSGDDSDEAGDAIRGTIHVCNSDYGENGWLGLARIWVTNDGHIDAGVVLMNDSYLLSSPYNEPNAWQHVLCQEVGHTFGLSHQASPKKRSCMNDRWGLTHPDFVGPNAHDYNALNELYGSADSGPKKACNPKSPKCNADANVRFTPRPGGGWIVTFTVPPNGASR